MLRHSLRTRIALVVAVISLVMSAVVGAVLAQQAEVTARDTLRDQTVGRLDAAAAGFRLDGRLRSGATTDTDGLPSGLADDLVTGERRTYYDGTAMWASERIGPQVVLTVQVSADRLAADRSARLRTLALTMLGSVLVSGVLGWLAGTNLSRRLRRAAVAATRVAQGDPGARTHAGGRDEVAVLTRAVDAMADALSARLETEKAFTADVAHELRTPLTGLVSAAELLPEDEASELVRAQVARMRVLVEDLLEISRLESGADRVTLEHLDLGEATRDALDLTLAALPEQGRPQLDVIEQRSVPVLVEPRRLERILHNLLVNLTRHGGGRGRLTIAGDRLVLQDHGSGYPQDVRVEGPRRFHGVGAGRGSGLGLTIVSRQVEAMGGHLELGVADTGGARTVVVLRRSAAPPSQPRPRAI